MDQETCPNCKRPYREQPSPTQDEMGGLNETRDMPGPGMEDDPGGNPLQEGIFKGNTGWKNREVRDDSFASVKQAQDDEYALPGGIPGSDDIGETIEPSRAFLMTAHGQVFDAPWPTNHEQIAQTLGDPQGVLSNSTTGYWNEGDKTARITGHASKLPPDALQQHLTSHYGVPVNLTGRLEPREQTLGVPNTAWERDWRKTLSPQEYAQRTQQAEEAAKARGGRGFGWENPFMPSRGGSREASDQTIHMPWWHVGQEQPEQQPEFPAEQMDVIPPGPPTVEANMTPSGLHDRVLDRLQDLSGKNDELTINGMPARQASDELNQHFTPYGNSVTSQWRMNRASPVTLSHPDPEKLDVAKQIVEAGDGQPYLDYVNRKHAYRDIVQPQLPFSHPNVHRGVGNLNPLIDGRPYRLSKDQLHQQGLGPVEVAAKNPQELELVRGLLHNGNLDPLIQYKTQQTAKVAGLGSMLGGVAGGLIGNAVAPGIGGAVGAGIGQAAGGLIGGGDGGGGGEGAAAMSSVRRSDLETPSSVPSIGEQADDPEKVDQKEFNAGPDMHNNLYDPSAEGMAGGATTEGGQGLDPDGKAAKALVDNLPTFLQEAIQGNHDHPTVVEIRNHALAENPNLEDEDHDDAVKAGIKDTVVENFHKRHGSQASIKQAQLGAAIGELAGSLGKAAPGIAKGAAQNALGRGAVGAAGSLGGGMGGGGSAGGDDAGGAAPPDTPDAGGGGPAGPGQAPDDSMSPDIGQQPITGHIAADPGEDPLEAHPDDSPDHTDQAKQPEAEPAGSVDSQGKGVKLVISNLPTVMGHYFSQGSGGDDPIMQMIDQAFQQEDPNWQDSADDNHPAVHDFFSKLLGSGDEQDSEHHPEDNNRHMDEDKQSKLAAPPSVDPRQQAQQPGMIPGQMPPGGPQQPGMGAGGPMPGGGAAGAGDAAQPDPSTSMGPGGGPAAPPGGGAGDAASPDQSTSAPGAGGPGAGTAPPGGAPAGPGGAGGQQGQQGGGTTCPTCGGPMVGGMCPTCAQGGAGGAGGGHMGSWHISQDPGTDPEQLLQQQQQVQQQQNMQQQQQQQQQNPNAGGPAAQEQQAAQVWQALTPPPHGRASLPPTHPRDTETQQDSPAGVVVPQGMQQPMPQDPSVAQVPLAPGAPQGNPLHQFMGSRQASMGPDTPEQQQAVIDYLLENGRQDEAPEVPTNPEKFAQELSIIQRKDFHPLPNEQTDQQPQPAQEEAPPGDTMPVPGMQVQQSMARALKRFGEPVMHHRPGDNGAYPERGTENPMLSPAAEQTQQPDVGGQEDSSMTWIDSNGDPLQPGQIYQMSSRSYDIPDVVRITRVRPDSISYEIEGEYNLRHETELTKEEADMDGLQFSPATEGADDEVGPEDFGQTTDFGRQPGEGNTIQQDMPAQDDLSTPHMRMTRRAGPDNEQSDLMFPEEWAQAQYPQRGQDVMPEYTFPEEWTQTQHQGPPQPPQEPDPRVIDPNNPEYRRPKQSPGQDPRFGPPYPGWGQSSVYSNQGDYWPPVKTAASDFMYEPSQPPTIPEGMTMQQYNEQGRPADPHSISQSGRCPNCGNTSLVPGQYCINCEHARSQSQRAVPNWNNQNATQSIPLSSRQAQDEDPGAYDEQTPEGMRAEDFGGSGRSITDFQGRGLAELELQLQDAERNLDFNAAATIRAQIDRIKSQLGQQSPQAPPQPDYGDQAAPQEQAVTAFSTSSASSRDWLREDGDFLKEGGARYSPMEQREFVTEPGEARNLEKLDLAGTHYEHDLDEELFLGF